jgi:hyperosmotically inducible periplasmic protein
MSLRLGALLCLCGIAACSNHPSETAKDPSSVDETRLAATDPEMRPASLEATSPPTPGTAPATQTPAVADTKGASSSDFKGSDAPRGAADAPSPTPGATPPGTQPDDTKVNERDRDNAALTPMDQKNNETDLKVTQQIRQAVMADDSLSFTAKNVKIIAQNGKVTLRGPVKTAEERNAIEAAARKVAGVTHVDNQIEVKK